MSYSHCSQLKLVKEQFDGARTSLQYVMMNWSTIHGEITSEKATFGAVQAAFSDVELTYTVRLFSEFEAILREYLSTTTGVRLGARTSIATVINRVTSRLKIDPVLHRDVQAIRAKRNELVHRSGIPTPSLVFSDAMSALNRYLARL